MSIKAIQKTFYIVKCDFCHLMSNFYAPTPGEAREFAKEKGWQFATMAECYCSECIEEWGTGNKQNLNVNKMATHER